MLASGNGNVQTCVSNLLAMRRYDCPLDRLKGIDGGYIDKNIIKVTPEIKASAQWLIENYEPRVEIKNLEIVTVKLDDGQEDTVLQADINILEE